MKAFFARLAGISGAVWNFFLPILRRIVAEGAADLLPLALDIVTPLALAKIPGEQKFALATARLREAAINEGIEAAESLIRFTVEAAVQRLKDETGERKAETGK